MRTTFVFMLVLLVIAALCWVVGGLLMLYAGATGWGLVQLAGALLATGLAVVIKAKLQRGR